MVLDKLLQKERQYSYQSAEDVLTDLQQKSVTPKPQPKPPQPAPPQSVAPTPSGWTRRDLINFAGFAGLGLEGFEKLGFFSVYFALVFAARQRLKSLANSESPLKWTDIMSGCIGSVRPGRSIRIQNLGFIAEIIARMLMPPARCANAPTRIISKINLIIAALAYLW